MATIALTAQEFEATVTGNEREGFVANLTIGVRAAPRA